MSDVAQLREARPGRASTYARWFDEEYGKVRKYQKWIECHVMVGTKTNVVTAAEVTEGNRNDSPDFVGLVKKTAARFDVKEITADKAYLSDDNPYGRRDGWGRPAHSFKLNSRPDGNGAAWNRLRHYFNAQRDDDFLDHNHRRSNVEATFSAIKRKFGGAVRAKNERAAR